MYTPEQVESEANHLYLLVGMSPSYLMLRAYAATLKAAQGGVTEAMVERVAQLTAHRACCGTEADPANGKLHGYCVVCGVPWPCEYAGTPPAALSAEPAAQGDAWDARGGSLWLDREQWGVVIDALIEHRASAAKRKNGNPDSTSDVRADECGDLIGKITSAAKSLTALSAQPAERVPEGWVLIDREVLEIIANSLPLKHNTMPYALEALGFARDEARAALTAIPAPSEGGKGVES